MRTFWYTATRSSSAITDTTSIALWLKARAPISTPARYSSRPRSPRRCARRGAATGSPSPARRRHARGLDQPADDLLGCSGWTLRTSFGAPGPPRHVPGATRRAGPPAPMRRIPVEGVHVEMSPFGELLRHTGARVLARSGSRRRPRGPLIRRRARPLRPAAPIEPDRPPFSQLSALRASRWRAAPLGELADFVDGDSRDLHRTPPKAGPLRAKTTRSKIRALMAMPGDGVGLRQPFRESAVAVDAADSTIRKVRRTVPTRISSRSDSGTGGVTSARHVGSVLAVQVLQDHVAGADAQPRMAA